MSDNTINYDDMDDSTKLLFMFCMQACFCCQDRGLHVEQLHDFIEGCWETMEMNGAELRDILYDGMIMDLKNKTVEFNV